MARRDESGDPMKARDKAIEQWLRQDIVATYDAMKANPARGRSSPEVRAALAVEYERTLKSG